MTFTECSCEWKGEIALRELDVLVIRRGYANRERFNMGWTIEEKREDMKKINMFLLLNP